jgi:hypothetical protein
MSTKYAAVIEAKQADYLETSLGQGVLKRIATMTERSVRVELSESAKDYLSSIPSDSDGHIDSEGVMWIGGLDYPLEILHNASDGMATAALARAYANGCLIYADGDAQRYPVDVDMDAAAKSVTSALIEGAATPECLAAWRSAVQAWASAETQEETVAAALAVHQAAVLVESWA